MLHHVSRRRLAAGVTGLALAGAALPLAAAEDALAVLERRHSGTLGVFALDTGSGRSLAYRGEERVLMCSTFKALLAAAVLARVDAGQDRLDHRIAYGRSDLLSYAPVARAHVGEGALSVEALCAAAVEVSDNTAANLLLPTLGGPEGLTRFLRGIGDAVTRMDRNEPSLNVPSGELDTSTPRAMAHSLRAILLGEALSAASRERLEGWMVASTTGGARLRRGFPAGWRAGDKTGTGATQANDVAIARPPGRAPLIVTAFFAATDSLGAARDAVLRDVGAIVAAWAG
ncbi:MAG: hypothetical protein JWR10_4077 [Rubritepida sp.]|nr:hypothetical protein [Rubritepida sp.]